MYQIASNEKQLVGFDLDELSNFGATSKYESGFAFVRLSVPRMCSNHSLNPNMIVEISKRDVIWVALRDLEIGEELTQNYLNYEEVPWYEDYLNERVYNSLRQWAIEYELR